MRSAVLQAMLLCQRLNDAVFFCCRLSGGCSSSSGSSRAALRRPAAPFQQAGQVSVGPVVLCETEFVQAATTPLSRQP